MINDHADIANDAFEATGLRPTPPLRTVEQALAYITNLLTMLPANEQAGYCKGPAGGENVSPLPDGTLVRVSRICYPDGDLYKVMSDAPNGNPQWHLEDHRPELYIPYLGPIAPGLPHDPPAPAVDLAPIIAQLNDLDARNHALHAVFVELTKQVGAINQQIADLVNKPQPPPPTLPELVVGPIRVFGMTFGPFPVRAK